MPGYHSPRSPSGAHRWRGCHASIREEEGLPDTAGEEAIQGTVFHDYAADCVELGMEPFGLVGDRFLCEDGEYRPFTQEMADKMLNGLDVIWAEADAPGATLYVEKRVSLEPWLGPKESGTSDAFTINILQRRLVTFDWKWGQGVPVSPVWNDQGILYTLGVWNDYAEAAFAEAGVEPKDVEVVIIIEQPRAPGGGGVWRTNMEELLNEGKKIKLDADATRDPNAKHNPGEKQCKFCKAAAHNTCQARADYIADMLAISYEDCETDLAVGAEMELPNARALSPEARTQILLNRSLIEKWLQSLHDEAMEDSKRGVPTPGLKRVSGRAPARSWIDSEKAEIILQSEFWGGAWNKKILSPAMVEDRVGKKAYQERFARHVSSGEAKPILVPETDARDPLPDYNSAFDDAWDEDQTDALI